MLLFILMCIELLSLRVTHIDVVALLFQPKELGSTPIEPKLDTCFRHIPSCLFKSVRCLFVRFSMTLHFDLLNSLTPDRCSRDRLHRDRSMAH